MEHLNDSLYALKKVIHEAFDSIPYPGDDALVDGSDMESWELRRAFEGKLWQEVGKDLLYPMHSDSLPFFSARGFAYYLPSYMVVAAECYAEVDVLPSCVVSALSPPLSDQDAGNMRKEVEELSGKWTESELGLNMLESYSTRDYEKLTAWFLRRVSGFTKCQKEAVIDFLEFLRKWHGGDYPGDEIEHILEFWRTAVRQHS